MKSWIKTIWIFVSLLLLLLTLGGISSASLQNEADANSVHNKFLLPQQNRVKNKKYDQQRTIHALDKSETTLKHSKLKSKKSKQSLLYDDQDDLYSILHEKDPKFAQNEYSSVMKTTNEGALEKEKEAEQERINTRKLYTLLLIPWIIYPVSKASYFTILELFNSYAMSQGVPAENAFLFQVIAQCVDFVALTRGRFKFIEGGMNNLQQEMLDYFLTKAGVPDPHKLSVQILLPVNDWPEYEQKKK